MLDSEVTGAEKTSAQKPAGRRGARRRVAAGGGGGGGGPEDSDEDMADAENAGGPPGEPATGRTFRLWGCSQRPAYCICSMDGVSAAPLPVSHRQYACRDVCTTRVSVCIVLACCTLIWHKQVLNLPDAQSTRLLDLAQASAQSTRLLDPEMPCLATSNQLYRH